MPAARHLPGVSRSGDHAMTRMTLTTWGQRRDLRPDPLPALRAAVVPLLRGAFMTRSAVVLLVAAMAVPVQSSPAAQAPDGAGLAGRWAIDQARSQFPAEVGFSVDWLAPGVGAEAGGRGGRGSPATLPTG